MEPRAQQTETMPGFEDARKMAYVAGGRVFCWGPVDGWCRKSHTTIREFETCLNGFRSAHGGRSDRMFYGAKKGQVFPLSWYSLEGHYSPAGGVYPDAPAEAR